MYLQCQILQVNIQKLTQRDFLLTKGILNFWLSFFFLSQRENLNQDFDSEICGCYPKEFKKKKHFIQRSFGDNATSTNQDQPIRPKPQLQEEFFISLWQRKNLSEANKFLCFSKCTNMWITCSKHKSPKGQIVSKSNHFSQHQWLLQEILEFWTFLCTHENETGFPVRPHSKVLFLFALTRKKLLLQNEVFLWFLTWHRKGDSQLQLSRSKRKCHFGSFTQTFCNSIASRAVKRISIISVPLGNTIGNLQKKPVSILFKFPAG